MQYARLSVDVSDYLIYAAKGSIRGLYVDPAVTSVPFQPIPTAPGVSRFDVDVQNKTLIAVISRRLKQISLDTNEVTDMLTAVNVSGLWHGRSQKFAFFGGGIKVFRGV